MAVVGYATTAILRFIMIYDEIHLIDYYNKPIEVECVIIGKSLNNYSLPSIIEYSCKGGDNETLDLTPDKVISNELLMFLNLPDSRILDVLTHIKKQKVVEYKVLDRVNVHQIFFTKVISKHERSDSKITDSHKVGYYCGDQINVNVSYRLKGFSTTLPKDQTTTYVFYDKVELLRSYDSYNSENTDNNFSELDVFKVDVKDVDGVYKYLDTLYNHYAANITKIYHRFDLHLFVDLSVRSVLSFYFDGELIQKGWTDSIILGDPRCGKGYVVERLIHYFGVGEVISADMCSLAGLLGGLQKFGGDGNWILTWGKIPINDCGLVVIDEASEIEEGEWSKLSRVRSEGIVEITKIQSNKTYARTRLIFIANPKNRMLSHYSYGVLALNDLIKTKEDIARFDYALIVSGKEVDTEDVNKRQQIITSIYDSDLESKLVLWLWSRKSDEVIFENNAISYIYKKSNYLASIYSTSIPLIQGETIRIKLAKIAIGFACRLFSTTNNNQCLLVKLVHAECAVCFLDIIYGKEASGYKALSKLEKPYDTGSNVNFDKLEGYFNAFKSTQEIYLCLIKNNFIKIDDLTDQAHLDQFTGRDLISFLFSNGCLIKGGTYGYVKTSTFAKWLKIQMGL